MPEALLEIRGLNVYFGQARILQGIDLDVGREPVTLVGRNGMGKTTLCQALMGLVPVAGGSIRFGGVELVGKKPHRVVKAGLGYVPQGRRLFPSLSVHEHLKLVERTGEQRWTVERVYDLFPRLYERRRHGAAQLSGGEQQMLAISRAMLGNPRLLVMDEPSEGLAPTIVDQLIQTVHQLVSEQTALLVIEQNLSVAAAIADRLTIMVTGRIALETRSEDLLADEAAQRRYLGVSAHGEAAG